MDNIEEVVKNVSLDKEEISESHLERILRVINKSIDDLYNEYENSYNPTFLDDLIECKQLGEKLMYFDYFKNSESFLDNVNNNQISNYKDFGTVRNKWDLMQKKETKVKEKDLRTFLNLVTTTFSELGEL